MTTLLIWALVTTALTGLMVYRLIKQSTKIRAEREALSEEIATIRAELRNAQTEIEGRDHIIARQQEVQADASKRKREIRSEPDPGDRARSATDVMSDLSGGRDGDSDGPASST